MGVEVQDANVLMANDAIGRFAIDLESVYARAGRELATPLLGISGAASAEGASALEELREALQVNSRLGEDYFIVPFDECGKDFLLRPSGDAEENEADRALSLATAWFDRYLPERLTQCAV